MLNRVGDEEAFASPLLTYFSALCLVEHLITTFRTSREEEQKKTFPISSSSGEVSNSVSVHF